MPRYASNIQIPNLGAAVSLDGTEQIEIVQSGESKRATTQQIADLGITGPTGPGAVQALLVPQAQPQLLLAPLERPASKVRMAPLDLLAPRVLLRLLLALLAPLVQTARLVQPPMLPGLLELMVPQAPLVMALLGQQD